MNMAAICGSTLHTRSSHSSTGRWCRTSCPVAGPVGNRTRPLADITLESLPVHTFPTDDGKAMKACAESFLTEKVVEALSDQGIAAAGKHPQHGPCADLERSFHQDLTIVCVRSRTAHSASLLGPRTPRRLDDPLDAFTQDHLPVPWKVMSTGMCEGLPELAGVSPELLRLLSGPSDPVSFCGSVDQTQRMRAAERRRGFRPGGAGRRDGKNAPVDIGIVHHQKK